MKTMPPLPKNSELEKALGCSVVHYKDALKYGQACREQALEEAAMAALEAPIKTHGQPLRQACANAIRSLK